jgi:hypothetical protein
MLCLTRHKEERTNLYQPMPDGTKRLLGSVMVLHAAFGKARLGFELAEDVEIVRDEIDGHDEPLCEGK